MNKYGDLQTLRTEISAHHRAPETQLLPALIQQARSTNEEWRDIEQLALQLITAVRDRADADPHPWMTDLLREYPLNTPEGLALMGLAECCLRIPDAYTTQLLIRDKLAHGNWRRSRQTGNDAVPSWRVRLSSLGLQLSQLLLNDSDRGVRKWLRLASEPFIRHGTLLAMRMIGAQFVFGTDIQAALKRAQQRSLSCSFDMLGEAARTRADAQRYLHAYRDAITALGTAIRSGHIDIEQHSISIKLSALHPRYETSQAQHALPELLASLRMLAELAMQQQVGLTIDAEECDRLQLSLDLVEQLLQVDSLHNWHGLSLAVQAYQKRALPVIKWLNALAQKHQRRIGVRLVKGAYWDMEIKRCQERGLSDFPVFTRKTSTDVSYLACARQLLASSHLDPAFATHNALTIATLLVWIKQQPPRKIEFQRLHGMGAGMYQRVMTEHGVRCRVYSPVGHHHELLPYLIRRMLENSSNSGFVQQLGNPQISVARLIDNPIHILQRDGYGQHPAIVSPLRLFGSRRNSTGLDLFDRHTLQALQARMLQFNQAELPLLAALPDTPPDASASKGIATSRIHFIVGISNMNSANISVQDKAAPTPVINPANHHDMLGHVSSATRQQVSNAIAAAYAAMTSWALVPVNDRAARLELLADLLQENCEALMALLIREAGKTRSDALGEVREAIDFCRYYAQQARELMREQVLPGPSGEFNALTLHPRGVFACISPWNFPLAIFLGQIAAALVTGNGVIAKPAPQTPLIANMTLHLLQQTGIPKHLVAVLPGGPQVGDWIVRDPRITGIAFTGSTATARRIARAVLEDEQRPLTAMVAETGGINAMIVDSTALPEQVVADVITSAFQSAGQRCSALRLLCLQDEIYDSTLTMLRGAMAELKVGDPQHEETDVGPLIDSAAHARIKQYLGAHQSHILYSTPIDPQLPGWFIAPTVIELARPEELQQEVFGPVLHVTRWQAGKLHELINTINASGYGLTLGLHSRLDSAAQLVRERAHVGNIYINRSMIAAIVGSQPFGGEGLSGTGPKAGGPHYLLRFCSERTTSIDITSAGGNAALMNLPA